MTWIPSYKRIATNIVSWSRGTDEEIVKMLEMHYAGEIDLTDYWSVGDERVVHLSAMEAMSPLTDTHTEQDVTFVLSNVGGKYLADGVTECVFQVDQKDCLNKNSCMNSTDTTTGGWGNCSRRTWCNSVYKNAFPSTLVGIFKEFINQSGTGGTSSGGIENTTDYFALRAEIEVFGSTSYSVSGEGSQVEWYGTSANRTKLQDDSPFSWWLRSPSSDRSFCCVTSTGTKQTDNASSKRRFAPFGVI